MPLDGLRINIPRELTTVGFPIYDKDRRHYPQGLLSCLYDVLNKTVYDFNFVPHINERTCALAHLSVLRPEDIVIFDRGYFSYLLLHEFWQSIILKNKISIKDNFFMVGGNSLHIPLIVTKINNYFETQMTIRDFILNSTIEENAAYILSKRKGKTLI